MIPASNADTRRVAKCTRLANLLLFLGARPRGATMEEVRTGVGGYADTGQSDEAFQRQFRRDRADLKRMGFPITVERGSTDEQARCMLASTPAQKADEPLGAKDVSLLRLCAQSALDDPSFPLRGELARALDKLHVSLGEGAGGGASPQQADGPDDDSARGEAARGSGLRDEHITRAIADAARSGGALAFSYEGVSAPPSRRSVVPLRVFSYLGAFYLHAFDIDKRACRRFRLERITDEPVGIDVAPEVLAEARTHEHDRLAALPFQVGTDRIEAVLRLEGRPDDKLARLTEGSGRLEHADDAWLWHVPAADAERLARWVVENSPGISIVEPVEARRVLADGLREAAGRGE